VTETDEEDGTVSVEFAVENHDGAEVMTGDATASLPFRSES
jgi:hypothetical protein